MIPILSDIVNVESRKGLKDCRTIGKSSHGSKKTIIRFINRKYCKRALLTRKQLEKFYLRKHQFRSGTKIFTHENLRAKNEQLVFNCCQLNRRNLIFRMLTKNDTIYIKQTENPKLLIILNMTILHDILTNFYDLIKKGIENRDKSGDQNASHEFHM